MKRASLLLVAMSVPLAAASVTAEGIARRPEGRAEGDAGLANTASSSAVAGPTDVVLASSYWFETHGDYAHISSTLPRAVSAHGWWINGNFPTGTMANVDVQVQLYFGGFFGWVSIGPNFSSDVPPGGGAGRRTTARVDCTGTNQGQYRSIIDVDIIGYIDDSLKLYTPPRTLACLN